MSAPGLVYNLNLPYIHLYWRLTRDVTYLQPVWRRSQLGLLVWSQCVVGRVQPQLLQSVPGTIIRRRYGVVDRLASAVVLQRILRRLRQARHVCRQVSCACARVGW